MRPSGECLVCLYTSCQTEMNTCISNPDCTQLLAWWSHARRPGARELLSAIPGGAGAGRVAKPPGLCARWTVTALGGKGVLGSGAVAACVGSARAARRASRGPGPSRLPGVRSRRGGRGQRARGTGRGWNRRVLQPRRPGVRARQLYRDRSHARALGALGAGTGARAPDPFGVAIAFAVTCRSRLLEGQGSAWGSAAMSCRAGCFISWRARRRRPSSHTTTTGPSGSRSCLRSR